MKIKSTAGRLKDNGFTLIEVMIAMSVFAILSVMAYGGLSNLLNQNERITKAQEALQELQFATVLLQQDINQIVDRSVRDEYGELQKPLISLEGAEKALEFTRAGWPNPGGQVRSSLLRSAWAVENEQLIRYYWKDLDRGPNSEALKISVLSGVDSMAVRFLNEENAWLTQWPATNISTQPNVIPKILPKAIEVVLTTKRWGEIKRVYPLVDSPAMVADDINPPDQNQNQN